jgi:hypothetical protein
MFFCEILKLKLKITLQLIHSDFDEIKTGLLNWETGCFTLPSEKLFEARERSD